ncbi:PQQ-dependent sugar dehydrogenase [Paeniglutamicibacter kerguelensis]|uniref:Glucose/arabinose dehydrogenase n=1 Tax=Paeniglutamicibacter kerguelensis TaxID=254788 RepID=A0ABS4XGH2_9MICC|nr:PQQ-dependent sugar dehydrogenase [Paeniglutamicibacter kerguelensis]MBP2387570.1 glucose/arabinose dehydrogenase [Paeniglutamicibacter kerguelensis]
MTAVQPGVPAGVVRRSFLLLAGAGTLAVLSSCSDPLKPNPNSPEQVNRPVVVASGLATPWSMARRSDGGTLVSERDTARVKLLSPDGTLETFAEVPGVVPGGEGGLLGLEVLEEDGREWLYAYASTETDNRVLRFEMGPDGLGAAQPIIRGIPRASIHNGGRIKFGPDGLLYIGTGDATDSAAAQDPARMNGKILRLNPDGSIPVGNPFTGSPVYSYGHRNVQGFAWDSSRRLWASELGPDKNDELNLVVPGSNYGWPQVTGAPHKEGFIDAVHVWKSTADASPSALAIVDGAAYVACLRGEKLWRLGLPAGEPASRGALPDARGILKGQGRLRDVLAVSGSGLWIATNEGESSRIISLALPGPGPA